MTNNKQLLKEYIAEKIFSIAFRLMPDSKIKISLACWYIITYGGDEQ